MRETPERLTRTLLLGSLLGFAYRGHWIYSAEDRNGVGGYLDLARGLGPAPHQYRVGVLQPAAWAYAHWHLPFHYSFTLMDVVGSVLAVMLGYHLLQETEVYRRAAVASQWFGSAAYLALVLYFLCWQDHFKKIETQPTAGLLMLMLWLWTPTDGSKSQHARWRGLALLAVALALSTLRPEFPLMAGLGVLVVAWRGGRLSLSRSSTMAVAACCMAIAAATQIVLAKIVYPQAHYATGYFFMLPRDIWRLNDLLCFVVFLLPAAWTLREVRRRRFLGDAAGVAMLLAAIPFVLLWMTIGRIEEVRIFLPLALAITPLTVQMAMLLTAPPHQDALAEPTPTR